jgi:hypothetical protein
MTEEDIFNSQPAAG